MMANSTAWSSELPRKKPRLVCRATASKCSLSPTFRIHAPDPMPTRLETTNASEYWPYASGVR